MSGIVFATNSTGTAATFHPFLDAFNKRGSRYFDTPLTQNNAYVMPFLMRPDNFAARTSVIN